MEIDLVKNYSFDEDVCNFLHSICMTLGHFTAMLIYISLKLVSLHVYVSIPHENYKKNMAK